MTDHVGRWVGMVMLGLVGFVVIIGSAAGGALGAVLGGPGTASTPEGASTSAISPDYLALYQHAAATCPGLSWTVLAAIGSIESGNGTSNLPGVHSGANSAGAEGPMQFEPGTFAEYALPVPTGGADPPNPYDPTDAVYAAARELCANGAGTESNLPDAVYAYNHAWPYVTEVLDLAQAYQTSTRPGISDPPASPGIP